eukprot:6154617-Pleurochrysis_carterae.AAC.1
MVQISLSQTSPARRFNSRRSSLRSSPTPTFILLTLLVRTFGKQKILIYLMVSVAKAQSICRWKETSPFQALPPSIGSFPRAHTGLVFARRMCCDRKAPILLEGAH